MRSLCYIFLVILFLQPVSLTAQKNRIQPGKRYSSGETIYSPMYGFSATIPDGWEGLLPRESEVFLLTSTTSAYGEIYMFASEKTDLKEIESNWTKGFELSEGISLRAINPYRDGDLLLSEVEAEGEYINKGFQEFAVAKCKETGSPCITALMVAPTQFYETIKETAIRVMQEGNFELRERTSPYSDFEWSVFLSNKLFMNFASVERGSKESYVHLCEDGTFFAQLTKKGIFKSQGGEYKGRLTGSWQATGIGSRGEITLTFSKKNLSAITAPLLIQDDNIFSNGERYFVGKSDRCQ